MAVKYIVNLSDEERSSLQNLTSKGKTTGRVVKRGQILLWADEGYSSRGDKGAVKQRS
jgi:hypothetical protein